MLTFNGQKYAKNSSELTESLFQPGGTCAGFYKRLKHGVKLFDLQNNLFAFIVDNKYGEQFIVSAGMCNGKPFYMFGLTHSAEKYLGLCDSTLGQRREAAQLALASL